MARSGRLWAAVVVMLEVDGILLRFRDPSVGVNERYGDVSPVMMPGHRLRLDCTESRPQLSGVEQFFPFSVEVFGFHLDSRLRS